MRPAKTVLLAGAAVVGLAGLTGLALAASSSMHEMTVQVPGGGVAHIQYTGDVAPKVMFVHQPATAFATGFWGVPSPFAELDRISAMMDRQMAQMMYQANLMQQAADHPLNAAVFKDMPAGSASYSFVSTMAGNSVCMRTMQITSSPNGGQPKVVSHTSGNCGDKPSAAPAELNTTPSSNGLQTISYKPTHTTQGSVRRGI